MQFQFLEAYSCPVNTLLYVCFLLNISNVFRATEDICNEDAAQTMFCQSQPFLTIKKKAEFDWLF